METNTGLLLFVVVTLHFYLKSTRYLGDLPSVFLSRPLYLTGHRLGLSNAAFLLNSYFFSISFYPLKYFSAFFKTRSNRSFLMLGISSIFILWLIKPQESPL